MKPEIPTTWYHRAVNLLCLILLVGIFAVLFIFWRDLPEQIPAHYDAFGRVDRWGGRGELLLCPIAAAVLYAGITLLERFPQIWNTGVAVTDANRAAVYRALKNLIVTLKLAMVFAFVFIAACAALARPLPGWFLPADLILIFAPLVLFLVRIVRAGRVP